MSTTRLADVIYGPAFMPTTVQRIGGTSLLRESGIAVEDAALVPFVNAPGDIAQMPFWNDISGNSNVSSDDPAQNATPNKITMGQDFARKIRRNNGWQSANLVSAVLAEDPLDIIAQLIADYWKREEARILVQIMNGVFAAPTMAGNVLDVATEAGVTAGVNLDGEVSANAHALLGTAGIELRAVLMHSRVFWNLRAAGYITYGLSPAGVPDLNMPYWDGKRVITSDECPRKAGTTDGYKYTSYFFASGAVGYQEATGDGGPEVPVELDSTASAGNGEGVRTMWHRRHWIMHPRGVKFTSASVAGASPTDAELANAANWERVYSPTNVRIVAVVTNG